MLRKRTFRVQRLQRHKAARILCLVLVRAMHLRVLCACLAQYLPRRNEVAVVVMRRRRNRSIHLQCHFVCQLHPLLALLSRVRVFVRAWELGLILAASINKKLCFDSSQRLRRAS
jgi:hypothetical protein